MVQVRPGRERALVRVVLDAGVPALRIARPGIPCLLNRLPYVYTPLYFLMDHII